MICFKDKTFCNARCSNAACERRFDDDMWADAQKWWESFKSEDPPPVAFSNFRDDAGCPGWRAPNDQ